MAQLDKLTEEEWKTVDIIFVSIGGNDAGFGNVIMTCTALNCAADPRG